MSGTAQQEEIFESANYAATGTESAGALKQLASERLAAHRRRRATAGRLEAGSAASEPSDDAALPVRARSAASRVREAVAARYRESVTYREFLAAEAERALQQAQAEAEVATRKAEAQMQLLEELREWDPPQPGPREVAIAEYRAEVRDDLAHAVADIAVAATDLIQQHPQHADFSAGLTVRLYEDLGAARLSAEPLRRADPAEADEQEATALDAEIAFRRAPAFEPHVPEPVIVSGNLIEFPRQLIAARKARPRLAEGPLREESAPEPQLRIFEVEPEQISAAPVEPTGAPEWQSMMLEAAPRTAPVTAAEHQFHYALQPQTAALELRLMAAAVDACCIGAALVSFACVVVEVAGHALQFMPLPLLGIASASVAVAFFVLYQLLFFTLSEATPGMRYARIALCTFSDDSPSHSAMRRRVLAVLLAASPLGLGLAWAWLDEDRLGWHDRISRMYQRAY